MVKLLLLFGLFQAFLNAGINAQPGIIDIVLFE